MVPDALSPVAPARVRCLLVPAGRITRRRFLDFVRKLQDESIIRLGDVSPHTQPGRETFSPLAFSSGVVIYDLSIGEPSPGQRALYPFEISREPLVIIGLADAREYGVDGRADGASGSDSKITDTEALRTDLGQVVERLRAIYNIALVHRLLLFDYVEENATNLDIDAVVAISQSHKPMNTSLKTVMCDLTSSLLAEMAQLARSIQGLHTLETPLQTMPEGYVRPTTDGEHDTKRQSWFPGSALRTSSPSVGLERLRNRASLPAHLFGSSPTPSSPSEDLSNSEATSPSIEDPATTFEQMQIQVSERRGTGLDGAANHVSGSGLGTDAVTDRGRAQGRGRIGIVIGSMFLIAGRWPDAVREFVQGGLAARAANDHIWHAKSVDLILVTLLLCAWAGIEFEIPPLCLPIAERSSVLLGKSSRKIDNMANEVFIHQAASRDVQVENMKALSNVVPEIIQYIVRLYTRTTAEPAAQLLLSDTFIRLSKLSTLLLHCPDLSENHAMEAIVLNRKMMNGLDNNFLISPQSPVRTEASTLALASIPPPSLQEYIHYTDRLAIYAGVAVVLGMLGFHRKKAFVLRDLLSVLLPALENSANDGGFGAVLQSFESNGTISLDGQVDGQDVLNSENDTSTIYSFLIQICRVYGAVLLSTSEDLEKKQLSRFTTTDSPPSSQSTVDEAVLLAARIESESMTRQFGSKSLKIDVLLTCISVCEVVPDVRGAIALSSSLLRTVSSGIAPGPQTVDGGPSLAQEGQSRVTETLQAAAQTARDLGIGEIAAEYWDDFLVREVEILPTSSDLKVSKRKRSELAAVQKSLVKKIEGPFIVNKFTQRTSMSKQELFVVAKEKFCFSVLLQNLYDIPLDIDTLEMDITGVTIESKMENISVGAYQTQRLRIIAQASTSGRMSVHGCLVKIRNCSMRHYPIFSSNWRPKERTRIKQQGLSLLLNTKERPVSTASDASKNTMSTKPVPLVVDAFVVDCQPRLTVCSTSLIQNHVMVLEGEVCKFTITVQNVGERPIDFVTLTFDDSTLPILQAAVQDRELPAADLYEVEYGIYRKSALRWSGSSAGVKIDPGQNLEFDVELLGKPGLTTGTVHFDYATLGSDFRSDDEDIFTRRTSMSFDITVNASIDLIRNDVFSLTGPLSHARPNTFAEQMAKSSSEAILSRSEWTEHLLQPLRDQLTSHDDDEDYCLFLLDFYNSWTSTLLVMPQLHRNLQRAHAEWQDALQLSEPIGPGQSTRFLVPVPRLSLIDPYAPIPSLNPASKRQFVVSAGKISESYERSSRDAFWHREELLKHIRVNWLDPATGRTGAVELRAIRLTVRMLDALKLENLTVDVGVTGSENVVHRSSGHFKTAVDDFVTITARLTNRSAQPIHPILRLQPSVRNQPYNVALDMSKKFAFTSLLQQPLPLLQPRTSTEVQLGAVFLCAGEFEVSASVEETKIWKPAGENAKNRQRSGSLVDLDVLSSERTERRIWFAKEPCKVDVYDPEN